MNVKVDFQLNNHFGLVDRIIFRLVLNGFSNAQEINAALPIFSDMVIANGIKNLVNRQMLNADVHTGTLSISDSISALLDASLNKSVQINIPDNLKENFDTGGIYISRTQDKNVNQTICKLERAILGKLLPEINIDVLIQSLDFVLSEDK
jgi:hypothetical protein